MRSLFVFNQFTASADAAAFVEIPRKGTVRAIQVFADADFDADQDSFVAEFSLVPYLQASINDAQGMLCVFGAKSSNTVNLVAINETFQMACPVIAGQRINLNAGLSGTTNVNVRGVIWFDG